MSGENWRLDVPFLDSRDRLARYEIHGSDLPVTHDRDQSLRMLRGMRDGLRAVGFDARLILERKTEEELR